MTVPNNMNREILAGILVQEYEYYQELRAAGQLAGVGVLTFLAIRLDARGVHMDLSDFEEFAELDEDEDFIDEVEQPYMRYMRRFEEQDDEED